MKRAAPFIAIFVIQVLCAFFFVSDILSSMIGFQTAPISWEMRELLEIGAAFGLIATGAAPSFAQAQHNLKVGTLVQTGISALR